MSNQERLKQLIALAKGEALFRPSATERWTHCPGSVSLSVRAPRERKSSSFALEGTAAHTVAKEALTGIRQPDEWTDRMVQLDGEGMRGHFVDEEMVDGVSFYVDMVRRRQVEGTQLLVEQFLSLKNLDPSDPIYAENRGTGDAIILWPAKRRISILDLKYGKGVAVHATSPQIRDYALMTAVCHPIPGGWQEIECVIGQPRAAEERDREKVAYFTPDQLFNDFLGMLLESMDKALLPDPPLNPGSWCRWCPGSADCPALRDRAVNIARDAFAAVPMLTVSSGMLPLPPPVTGIGQGSNPLPEPVALSVSDIATILERRDLFDAWMTAVERRAVAILTSGGSIPGWKITQRTGNRKWVNAEEAQSILRRVGVSVGEMTTDPKLRTPKQLEMLLAPEYRWLVKMFEEGDTQPQQNRLVTRELGAITLVKASDTRQALPGVFTPIVDGIPTTR